MGTVPFITLDGCTALIMLDGCTGMALDGWTGIALDGRKPLQSPPLQVL
jgi:hypothetical protein